MSHEISRVEQDKVAFTGGNEPPSYDELAAHNGPNSRFGRWRGWIEKRAAERYADLTADQRQRRRERGWELNSEPRPQAPSSINGATPATGPSSRALAPPLHIQTSNLSLGTAESTIAPSTIPSALPFGTEKLSPSQLRICQFGSRFLPHATSQIRCLLPLMGDRYLLIGHDEGLSVLDMFPQEWNESGDLVDRGPSEAIARQIWVGESVQQMTILEMDDFGDGTPTGVVLALVGPDLGDCETPRGLRMYNLSSLVSLAKWAISTKGAHPLDLQKNHGNGAPRTPPKKHRPQHSIARSLMNFMEPQGASSNHGLDTHSFSQKSRGPSPNRTLDTQNHPQKSRGSSFDNPAQRPLPSITESISKPKPPSPTALSVTKSESSDSSWELLDFEGLPQRWASDYVPLATSGSRLVGLNVLSYAFWCDENRKGRGGQLLAIVTKNNILLYETPKGERAFRFVKEFYTPLQPRSVNFFHQNVVLSQENKLRGHKRSDSTSTIRPNGQNSSSSLMHDYGTHLSLFVIFDKKAGWIRIADSAVGEMEISDELHASPSPRDSMLKDTLNSPTATVKRIRHSINEPHSQNKWGPPITKCNLPFEQGISLLPSQIHLVTRGKRTQVMPCPLPANFSITPLWTVRWRSPPSHVQGRLYRSEGEDDEIPPFLQIVALGDGGIEVQEIPVFHLTQAKGKGKARVLEPSWAHEDIGGPVGFLCVGGHWDNFDKGPLRSSSSASVDSNLSNGTSRTEERVAKLKRQEGIYGWWCKDYQDWRVFWVGGISVDDDDSDTALQY